MIGTHMADVRPLLPVGAKRPVALRRPCACYESMLGSSSVQDQSSCAVQGCEKMWRTRRSTRGTHQLLFPSQPRFTIENFVILFGVRGKKARTLDAGRSQVNLIASRKREHSRKNRTSSTRLSRVARGVRTWNCSDVAPEMDGRCGAVNEAVKDIRAAPFGPLTRTTPDPKRWHELERPRGGMV